VIVEGSAIDVGQIGDVLNRDLLKALLLHEAAQGTLERLPGSPDSWIANFAV
jgi:hypothetical protein